MPAIGEGQIAWFESAKALVAAEDNDDLVNYVVPDGHQLHICSGVVCIDFPVLARYDLRSTPGATWVLPTSHIDGDSKWNEEENVYDGNLPTYGWTPIDPDSWGSFLQLLINEVGIDTIRFNAFYNAAIINQIDVDVYYDGDWHDVYEGAYTSREWVEKAVLAGASLISKARVRFYNDAADSHFCSLYEFMFNTADVTPTEGITFDTITPIAYNPQAPYIVEAGATFAIRVYNDDDANHTMTVVLSGYLTTVG